MSVDLSFKGDETPFDELQRHCKAIGRLFTTSFTTETSIGLIVDVEGRKYAIRCSQLTECEDNQPA
jgi:hypothetical protein